MLVKIDVLRELQDFAQSEAGQALLHSFLAQLKVDCGLDHHFHEPGNRIPVTAAVDSEEKGSRILLEVGVRIPRFGGLHERTLIKVAHEGLQFGFLLHRNINETIFQQWVLHLSRASTGNIPPVLRALKSVAVVFEATLDVFFGRPETEVTINKFIKQIPGCAALERLEAFVTREDWKLGDGYVTLNVDQATVDEMEETRKRYAAQYEIANYEGELEYRMTAYFVKPSPPPPPHEGCDWTIIMGHISNSGPPKPKTIPFSPWTHTITLRCKTVKFTGELNTFCSKGVHPILEGFLERKGLKHSGLSIEVRPHPDFFKGNAQISVPGEAPPPGAPCTIHGSQSEDFYFEFMPEFRLWTIQFVQDETRDSATHRPLWLRLVGIKFDLTHPELARIARDNASPQRLEAGHIRGHQGLPPIPRRSANQRPRPTSVGSPETTEASGNELDEGASHPTHSVWEPQYKCALPFKPTVRNPGAAPYRRGTARAAEGDVRAQMEAMDKQRGIVGNGR